LQELVYLSSFILLNSIQRYVQQVLPDPCDILDYLSHHYIERLLVLLLLLA
jgi:hypothetical protein